MITEFWKNNRHLLNILLTVIYFCNYYNPVLTEYLFRNDMSHVSRPRHQVDNMYYLESHFLISHFSFQNMWFRLQVVFIRSSKMFIEHSALGINPRTKQKSLPTGHSRSSMRFQEKICLQSGGRMCSQKVGWSISTLVSWRCRSYQEQNRQYGAVCASRADADECQSPEPLPGAWK